MTDALAVLSAALLLALTVPLLGFFAHALSILLLGAVGRREKRRPNATTPRFVVVIPAHDEERVLATSLRSLGAQRYPSDRVEVVVVADRCEDLTATIAGEEGARVLERREGPEGKAAVVAHALAVLAADSRWDALCIFDADNAVDAGFLESMAARLDSGSSVVQGFVDAGNPGASWVSASSALGYWAIAALAQIPRERAGLSSPVMGTGFVVRRDVALRYMRDGESLTDDLELGARLALDGVRVDYEHAARVVEEKPAALSTAVTQRRRWMQGRFAVAGRYLPSLMRAAIAPGRAPEERLRAADVAVQLVAPSLSFVAVGLVGIAVLELVLAPFLPQAFARTLGALVPRWTLGVGLVGYAIPALGIARFRPPLGVWRSYAVQPFYLALSVPLGVTGFLTRGSRTWSRTPKGNGPHP